MIGVGRRTLCCVRGSDLVNEHVEDSVEPHPFECMRPSSFTSAHRTEILGGPWRLSGVSVKHAICSHRARDDSHSQSARVQHELDPSAAWE